MKVKMLSRNLEDALRETKKDIHKVPRNYKQSLHPFEVTREYTRVLNAVKLERVFAKPFLGSFDEHRDGISCLSKHPQHLSTAYSGSCDGEIRIWNIGERKCLKSLTAHVGFVRGICFNTKSETMLSCGDDKVIKQWSLADLFENQADDPAVTIIGKTLYTGMDHHRKQDVFSTCGQQIDVWDEEKVEPVRTYKDNNTSVSIKFNQSETNYLLSTLTDRSVALFDIRHPFVIRKVVMKMNSNAAVWNPLKPLFFTAANEDYNLYTFDMRKMNVPVVIHKDHISAVMDLDFSPTGEEFVSGSYDKTIRIFPSKGGHSRDVYHTKRMQRVSCVKWSLDSRFIYSASDDMVIRVWKANASEKLGVLKPREKEAFCYSQALKNKFAQHPQVKRIARHRHVPRHVYTAAQEHRIIHDSLKRKETNKRLHSKPGTVPFISEKNKKIVSEIQ
ncbi:hypothetical protein HELRODRAFT_63203 [Helobdella robusta]|uniref:DDB1- and CUL4-associated factor 13 n=1 Tax=Helobdella robusta TaxID=6412 RepID=T1FXC2_HELRO|nr:hypothetical protein HELRODRAFT_63203 [Helobdella robusta]ESO12324.1 hypothetical protein HELRODRAFT_63203 [Helobdella robusta]